MPVIANINTNTRKRRVERRITKVAGLEIELLPEAGVDVRNVVLAILAEIGPVSIDYGSGVVVDAGNLFFVDWDDDYHAVLLRRFLHQLDGRPVGNFFDGFVPAHLLLSAKVRRRKYFLHAQDLHALFGRVFDHRQMLFNVQALDLFNGRVSRPGVLRLNQSAFNYSWHISSNPSLKSRVPSL